MIHRENLAQFLTWAFLDRDTAPEEGSEEARELENYVNEFETNLGRRLPEGYNQGVRSLRLTLDPVKMTHRSLLWYFVSFLERATGWIDAECAIDGSLRRHPHIHAPRLPRVEAVPYRGLVQGVSWPMARMVSLCGRGLPIKGLLILVPATHSCR